MLGFKKVKEGVKKAGRDVKEGYRRRKDFSVGLWERFLGFFRDAKGRELVRKEIPVSEAVRSWGFGLGEAGYRRARTATLFMWVFFLAIFVWCSFYLMRSVLVHGNWTAAFGSLIGMATGLVVCVINLWRWQVLRCRKYVPFLDWVKRGGAIS